MDQEPGPVVVVQEPGDGHATRGGVAGGVNVIDHDRWGLFGYRVDPDHPRDPGLVHLDEAESAQVVQMFAWYLEPQTTLYTIAKRLSDLSLPTPTGKSRWNASTVRGILQNPAYIGNAYSNRSRPVAAKRRKSALLPIGPGESKTPRPMEEWIAVPVPVIVSPENFGRVQAKLAMNQQSAPRNNKTHQYLLRGMVSCGKCRLSATARTLPSGYQYYVCRGRTDSLRIAQEQRCTARYIPATQLDDLVWQDLCLVVTSVDILRYALERAHGGHWLPQELQSQLEALNKASKQLEHQQERLLEAYIASIIQLPEFERKRKELLQKQEALHKQEFQLQATSTERINLSQVADSIEAFCAKIRPTLEHASFEQKRQLIDLLIDRVVVLDGDVEIRYVIPTQPDGPHIPFCHLRSDYRTKLP